MPDILLPVSSLTFNQSSKSGGDYPDGFQSERVRCQADVSRRAAASVEACHPWQAIVLERICDSSVWLISISCDPHSLNPTDLFQGVWPLSLHQNTSIKVLKRKQKGTAINMVNWCKQYLSQLSSLSNECQVQVNANTTPAMSMQPESVNPHSRSMHFSFLFSVSQVAVQGPGRIRAMPALESAAPGASTELKL